VTVRIAGLILVILAARSVAADRHPPAFVVIVHPGSRVTRVDRRFLAEIFLRRATRWQDDTPIQPVDLGPDAPARARFTQDVLSRSVASVRSYWQQRIFSGQGLPPPELASDAAVVSFVSSHRGAIGYVAPGAPVSGVTIVDVD